MQFHSLKKGIFSAHQKQSTWVFKDTDFHAAFLVPKFMDWGIEGTKDKPIEKDVDRQTIRIDECNRLCTMIVK